MAREIRKGDKVVIKEGAFKGEKGVVESTPFAGAIKVVLEKNGETIDTYVAHVQLKSDSWW